MKKYLLPLLIAAGLWGCETAPEEAASADATGAAETGAAVETGERPPLVREETSAPSSADRLSPREELVQNVGDRVFYNFDSAVIREDGERTLKRQAEWLKGHPEVEVIIEGHADERGTREYNLALGDRRASAVKNYLVSMGIDPSRITVISYGKERPIAPGHSEESWAQNRVAITVVR